jgi:hypothetical protein
VAWHLKCRSRDLKLEGKSASIQEKKCFFRFLKIEKFNLIFLPSGRGNHACVNWPLGLLKDFPRLPPFFSAEKGSHFVLNIFIKTYNI